MNTKTHQRTDIKFSVKEEVIILTIHLDHLNNFDVELLDIIGNKLYEKHYKEQDYIAERIDLTSYNIGLLYFKVNIGDETIIKELINHKKNNSYIM